MFRRMKTEIMRISLVRLLALARSRSGALGQLGWLHVDFEKLHYSGRHPVPWFIYGSIDFIEHQINPLARVLELGGGGSTAYWLNRGHAVVTVEQSPDWLARMKGAIGANDNWTPIQMLDINPHSLDTQGLGLFDVIVNDFSGPRADVASWMVRALKPGGWIIWDNSDRKSYQDGLEYLKSEGFGYVRFFGLGPINSYASETTVFSKSLERPTWTTRETNSIEY